MRIFFLHIEGITDNNRAEMSNIFSFHSAAQSANLPVIKIQLNTREISHISLERTNGESLLKIPSPLQEMPDSTIPATYLFAACCLIDQYFEVTEADIFYINQPELAYLASIIKEYMESHIIYDMDTTSLFHTLLHGEKATEATFIHQADTIVCNSKLMFNTLADEYSFPENKLCLLPVPAPRLSGHAPSGEELLRNLGIHNSNSIIFYICEENNKECLQAVIGAFARLKNELPEAKLIIAGDNIPGDGLSAGYGHWKDITFIGSLPLHLISPFFDIADVALILYPGARNHFLLSQVTTHDVPVILPDTFFFQDFESHDKTIKLPVVNHIPSADLLIHTFKKILGATHPTDGTLRTKVAEEDHIHPSINRLFTAQPPASGVIPATVAPFRVSLILSYYRKLADFSKVLPVNAPYFQREGIEVIIVMDEPSEQEGLLQLISNYPSIHWKVIVNEQEHPWRNPCKAWNVGIRHAAYETVMVIDPECELHTDVISILWNKMAGREHYYAIGKVTFMDFNEEINAENAGQISFQPYGSIMMRKAHLEKVGGYTESYATWGGEDDNLRAKLQGIGIKEIYSNNAIVIHREMDKKGNAKRSLKARRLNEHLREEILHPPAHHYINPDWGRDFDKQLFNWQKKL
ncbi:galactosyltransferase-related protein [Chitinophaga flava]|uniref:Galactosyltransferase C-terminal domain-containing protein n=1 Tax=Chitinophaga flava TaxID=2259036 RepID=A0A365XUS6_9BACT|nr:galactosyltransferase-related protein [Chitinophaga flava]RBL89454.1 hypothetical protein DF182_23350 [Chitinophaga flava]